jgi:hypothetical protein
MTAGDAVRPIALEGMFAAMAFSAEERFSESGRVIEG